MLMARNKIREACAALQVALKESTLDSTVAPIDLTLGDPTKFGARFHPPRLLVDAVVASVTSGTNHGYAIASGTDSARQAIATAHGAASKDDVVISGGCGASVDATIRALCPRVGADCVLVPKPGFPLYETSALMAGIECEYYNLNASDDFNTIDLDELASRIASKRFLGGKSLAAVKCVVVNSPSNPCGSVFSREHLEKVASFVKAHFPNAVILSDEVYSQVVFKHACEFASMGGDFAKRTGVSVVQVDGLSKNWHAPGWRMGWAVAWEHEPGALDEYRIAAKNWAGMTMGACTIVQAAVPAILSPSTLEATRELRAFREQANARLREAVDALRRGLSSAPGLEWVEPAGAMYIFIKVPAVWSSTTEFCAQVAREQKLLLLPSGCFGMTGYVRASIAAPADVLLDASARLASFCRAHPKGDLGSSSSS